MSEINPENILKLGSLARIGIKPEQSDELAGQLQEILDYVSQLQSVDTAGVAATSQVTGLSDVWREDVVVPCDLDRSELFHNTPSMQDSYIKVKRVL